VTPLFPPPGQPRQSRAILRFRRTEGVGLTSHHFQGLQACRDRQWPFFFNWSDLSSGCCTGLLEAGEFLQSARAKAGDGHFAFGVGRDQNSPTIPERACLFLAVNRTGVVSQEEPMLRLVNHVRGRSMLAL
jgi:hypothetical protein